MNQTRPAPRHWRGVVKRTILLALALTGAGLVVFWSRGLDLEESLDGLSRIGPVPFFAVFATLPAFGFPVTPFLLLSGAAYGVAVSILGLGIAYLIHLAISYWLSRKFLRQWVKYILARTRYSIPEPAAQNHLNFCLLVRVTPGPPSFLKSSIIALAGIPFSLYMLVSWPVCMGYAIGVIILGDSFTDGNWLQAVIGLAVMVLFIVALKVVRDRLEKKDRADDLPFS